MYKVTTDLNINGFSVLPLSKVIERNNGSKVLNTFDYFCIYLVFRDTEFIIEGKKYQTKRGNLLFVGPSNSIIFCDECQKEDAVYVLSFTSSFYERSTNDTFLLNSELFFNENSEIIITKASMLIDEIYNIIINRLILYKEKNNTGLYISVAHNCVEALLLDGLFSIDKKIYKQNAVNKFNAFDVTNKFRVMLQKNYKKERQVAFYAEKLNVTPRRLSEMTETIYGKTAKQFIVDKVVNESIRILKNSSLSIYEIAYELGFKDEANFSTFIKKHTQKNPKDLRLEEISDY